MSSFFLIPTITAPMPAAATAIQAYTLASMLSPVCGALPLSVEELLVDELSADEPSAGADGSVTVPKVLRKYLGGLEVISAETK